ncbi:uncharacterized protein LOC117228581 [Megalopta genalis]|uniref:uncharacterized protein LOC117228581 n=1 Tax=Megalopta genalis TaxID=115081 RepID=UPI003FCF0B76
MAIYLYLTSFYFLFIISTCMGNICSTCRCTTTLDDGSIYDCSEKYLGNQDVLYYYLLMLDQTQAFEKLSLSRNDIVNLSENFLKTLKFLKSLDLSENQIDEICIEKYKNFYRLENLNFSKNNITIFDTSLLKVLPTLLTLDLSYNRINLIKYEIDETVAKLSCLNLSHNNISNISNNFFDSLSNLQYLDLSFNKIHYMEHVTLIHLNSLKVVRINNNFLTSLDITKFPKSLTKLFAGYNLIQEINYALSQIEVLNIEFNSISRIQSNITMFKNLQHLNISGNKIPYFPYVPFENLRTLDLSYNMLTHIPTLSMYNLPSLIQLNVSKNPIDSLNFSYPLKLESFVASNLSMLETIDKGTFMNLSSPLNKCINLTISNNEKLFTVHEDVFHHLRLCSLDLSNNKISYIASKLILRNGSFTMHAVNLQGNPFKCNCSLQWLLNDVVPKLHSTDPQLLDNLRCAWPPHLSNMRMIHWYRWSHPVFCSNVSDFSNKFSMNAAGVLNGNQVITFDTSTGLLAALGITIGLLTILMMVGMIWTRKLTLKRRRSNRKF